jgi:hypothetical protein
MSNAGVHMLEAGTFPINRPQTAAQTQSPGMAILPTRPATAATSSVFSVSKLGAPPSNISTGLMLPPPAPNRCSNSTSPYRQQFRAEVPQPTISLPLAGDASFLPVDTKQVLSYQRETTSGDSVTETALPAFVAQAPAIDLYTPRPSTAPGKVTQHLSQVLPPKRELPFKRTSARLSPAVAADPKTISQYSRGSNPPGQPTTDVETIIPDSQNSANASSAKKQKTSSKAPRAKKQTAQPLKKIAKGKAAPQTKAQKCDACK